MASQGSGGAGQALGLGAPGSQVLAGRAAIVALEAGQAAVTSAIRSALESWLCQGVEVSA